MLRIHVLMLACTLLWACSGEGGDAGDSCAADDDCKGDLICPGDGGGVRRCTASCYSNNDCLAKLGNGFICGVDGLLYCVRACDGTDDATCPGGLRCIADSPGSSYYFCLDPRRTP